MKKKVLQALLMIIIRITAVLRQCREAQYLSL